MKKFIMKSWTTHGFPEASFLVSGAITVNRFVKLISKNTVAAATAATDFAIGVALDTAETNQSHIAVQCDGFATIEASAAIAFGAKVTATTDGKAVATTTAGDLVCGVAMEAAGADGELIEIRLIQPQEYAATDAA